MPIAVEEELGSMSRMVRKTCTSATLSSKTTFNTFQRQDASWASSLGYSSRWHLHAGRSSRLHGGGAWMGLVEVHGRGL